MPYNYFKDLDPSQLIYVVVDNERFNSDYWGGWQQYQNHEPGCLESFFSALSYITEDIESKNPTPLSLEYLQQVHALVARFYIENTKPGVTSSWKRGSFNMPNGGYSVTDPVGLSFDSGVRLIFVESNSTVEGILQLIQKGLTREDNPYFGKLKINHQKVSKENISEILKEEKCTDIESLARKIHKKIINPNYDGPWISYIPHPKSYNDIACDVEDLIDTFNIQIKDAKSSESILRLIVELAQNLNQIHPFGDFNIRTHILLIMNRLLILNDLWPALFDNPNVFDFYSVNELVDIVKKGQKSFQDLSDKNFEKEAALEKITEEFTINSTEMKESRGDYLKSIQHRILELKLEVMLTNYLHTKSEGYVMTAEQYLKKTVSTASCSFFNYTTSTDKEFDCVWSFVQRLSLMTHHQQREHTALDKDKFIKDLDAAIEYYTPWGEYICDQAYIEYEPSSDSLCALLTNFRSQFLIYWDSRPSEETIQELASWRYNG